MIDIGRLSIVTAITSHNSLKDLNSKTNQMIENWTTSTRASERGSDEVKQSLVINQFNRSSN